jgi:anaerobic magnesium-protoporphyrin IX monomethyl ester cyclase
MYTEGLPRSLLGGDGVAVDLLLSNPYLLRHDPVTRDAMDIYPLLGHGYLASSLEAHGAAVAIHDATFDPDLESFRRALDATRPRMVGVYGHLISRANAFAAARMAKERGLLTVAGGPDATGYWRDYLENGFAIVVRSEGEETARELWEWQRAGADPGALARIAGIAYRTPEGHLAVNNMRPFIANVDALPFPRRDAHVYEPYVRAWQQRHGYVSLAIFGARGCPYDCAFCYRPVFGRSYRRRSPANIVAEIEACAARFGASHFRFVDDTFVVHKPWVHELAARVRASGLNLSFDILARTNLFTDEVAHDLKEMGVSRVCFGMESGSDRVLDRMSKRLTVADTLRAAAVARRHDLAFLSWIMLGYPGEEKEDIYLTRDMLVQVKPDVLSISVAFPIRGTAFYDEVKDRISLTRPFWRRTGENRMVWQGRYSDLFYAFARRWLGMEVSLARGEHPAWVRPLHQALKWLYRLGMEVLALLPRARAPGAEGARQPDGPPAEVLIPLTAVGSVRSPDNLSNRTVGEKPYA